MGKQGSPSLGEHVTMPSRGPHRVDSTGGLVRKLILKMSISVDGVLARPHEELDFARSRSADGVAWLLEKLSNVGGHVLVKRVFARWLLIGQRRIIHWPPR